jgi:single-strand DNA-binding protein
MNQVVLIGRLCADPELRYTNNGTAVANFTLAVDRRYSKEKQADFINIVAWKAQAENCAKYIAKGSQVAVEGRIQTRKYQDREGNNRTAFEVVANSVQFLSRMRQPGEDVDQVAADMFGGQIDEDDCPF